MVTANAMDRLSDVAQTVRAWCRERGLDVGGVALHYHPRWHYEVLKTMNEWQVSTFIHEVVDGMNGRVCGVPVVADGTVEDAIAVTVSRTEANYTYWPMGYVDLPRSYSWEDDDGRA